MMSRISHLFVRIRTLLRGSAKIFYRFFIADKRRIALVVIFSTILAIIGIRYFSQVKQAEGAGWFNERWSYRRRISLSVGTSLTDYQVGFTLPTSTLITAGKMKNDCSDIRIIAQDGRELPYWIEENDPGCNSVSTEIWVKAPVIPTTGMNIYVYYGNPQAQAASSGKNVFPFFDDFNTRSLKRDLWATTTEPNVFGTTAITLARGSIFTNNPIVSTGQGYMYESRINIGSTALAPVGMVIGQDQALTANNGQSDRLVMNITSGTQNANMNGYVGLGDTAGYNYAATQYTYTVNSYHITSFSMDTSTVRFYNNRVQTGTYPNTWSQAPYMYLGYFTGSSASNTDIPDMNVDWVLARKYSSSAPTLNVGATEESGGPPLSFWKFDEIGGTTIGDSIKGTNGSFITGGNGGTYPLWMPNNMCISGGCLSFDGTDDYVTTNRDYSWAKTEPFTFSIWVNMRKIGDQTIFGKGSTGATNEYSLKIISGTLPSFVYWDTGGSTAIDLRSNTVLTLNKWQHIEVTHNGTTAIMYLDGKQVASKNSLALTFQNRANSITIGKAAFTVGVEQMFGGLVDEFKVFNYARSPTQVASDYIAGAGSAGASAVLGSSGTQRLNDQLKAYYKMDEVGWTGTAGEVKDASGNNYNGTANLGANVTAAGKFGGAGYFNGTDHVVVGTAPDFTTGDFSISTWFKLGDTAPSSPLMGKGFSGSGPGYGLRLSSTGDNSINFWLGDGSNTAELPAKLDGTTPYLTAGTWYHVAAVRKDGIMSIYLNGRKGTQTTAFTGSVSNAASMYIGSRGLVAMGNNYIDELRMYSRALSPSEVEALYKFAPGPVIYFPFDDSTSSTTVVWDRSGNNISGTVNGTMVAKNWVNGVYGSALLFDGTNDYVSADQASSLVNKTQGTMEMWVTLKSRLTTYQSLMSFGTNSQADAIELYQSSGGVFRFEVDENSIANTFIQGPANALNTLYHIAGVWKTDGSYYLYVNGQMAVQGGTYPYIDSAIDRFRIGADRGGANQSGAIIDEVRVYNYARTPGQILDDYTAGTPAVDRPVGYWKMDEGLGGTVNNSGLAGSSANGAFGTGNSAPTWTNSGKFGKALTFGASDRVTIPSSSSMDTSSEITMSAWIKPSSTAPEPILEYNSGGVSGVHLWQWTTYDQLFANIRGVGPTNHQIFSKVNAITKDIWQYVAMTYDGNTARLYVNGNIVGETIMGSFQLLTSYPFSIGNRASAGDSFTGTIDEVKVFAEALTQDQIKADYNQGKSTVLGSASQTSTGAGDNSSNLSYCPPGDTDTCRAPTVEWKFDEGSGTTLYDSAGSGLTAVFAAGISAPNWINGIHGQALDFDGSQDSINGGSNNTYCPANETVSTFFKIDQYPASDYDEIARLEGANGFHLSYIGGGGWDIGFKNSAAGLGGDIFITSGSVPAAGIWHHMAGTVDGSKVSAYVDGMLVGSTALVGSRTGSCNTNKLYLGGYGTTTNSGRHYDGKIDQFRIYDYARTPAQIAWEYNKGAPVAWYKMDECEGATINNSAPGIGESPPGYAGTLSVGASGMTSVGTCKTSGAWANGAVGKRNASMSFDGSDDTIGVTSSPNIDFGATSDFSVAFWTKFSSDTSNKLFLTKWNGFVGYPYAFQTSPSGYGISFARYDNTHGINPVVEYDKNITNSWHHIVGLKNGSTLYLYVDGILRGTTTDTTISSTNNSSNLYIGGLPGGSFIYGQIDDVRIFNYALTSQQVMSVMNNGAVSFQ